MPLPRLPATATLFGLVAFALPPTALLLPKAVVLLLVAAALLGALAQKQRSGAWPWPQGGRIRRVLIALALLLGWCALASIWSPDPGRAALLVMRLGGLFAAAMLLFTLSESLGATERRMTARLLAGGLALALAILLIERLLGAPFMTLLHGPFGSTYHKLSAFNRGATALAILAWPVAGLLWRERLGPWALLLPLALLALLLFFESAAALLGLAVGILVTLVALWQRRAARWLLMAALAGAFLAGPSAARMMYQAGWSDAPWLQSTARHRVHVWNFTAERIFEQPVLGWGFDAARNIPEQGAELHGNKTKAMPLHPHNGALQIQLELGLPGALTSLALLLLLVQGTARLGPVSQVCALAMATTMLSIALTAYGIWQNQWLALLALSVVLLPASAEPPAPDQA